MSEPTKKPMPENQTPLPTSAAPLQDKTPAPLLSRKKKEKEKEKAAARVVQEIPPSTVTEKSKSEKTVVTETSEDPEISSAAKPKLAPVGTAPKKRFSGLAKMVGWLVVLAAIGALGYTTYLMYRETRLEGVVAAPSLELQEVYIVRDFRAEAMMLANELAMSRAPLLSDIKQTEENFARIRGDVAGRDERLRLLGQEVQGLEKEIDAVVHEAQAESRGLWETEGIGLNADYEEKLSGFEKMLVERAKQLNIKFEPNQEYRVPEVWVNAFRLALYNVGSTINPATERQWADRQLDAWKEYSKTWDEKMAALKEQIKKVQSSPKEKIERITERRNDLRAQMAETEVEVGPLRRDLESQQEVLSKIKSNANNLEKSFYPQLVQTLDNNKILPVSFRPEDKTFSWRRIDRSPQYPPGQYYLWLKGMIGNEEYWSFVPFTLSAYSTTELIIYTGGFVKVSDILRSAITD